MRPAVPLLVLLVLVSLATPAAAEEGSSVPVCVKVLGSVVVCPL